MAVWCGTAAHFLLRLTRKKKACHFVTFDPSHVAKAVHSASCALCSQNKIAVTASPRLFLTRQTSATQQPDALPAR